MMHHFMGGGARTSAPRAAAASSACGRAFASSSSRSSPATVLPAASSGSRAPLSSESRPWRLATTTRRSSSTSPLLGMWPLTATGRSRFYSSSSASAPPSGNTTGGEGSAGDAPAAAAAPPPPPPPPVSINIQSMEEYQKLVLDASKTKPIIVDCYADWCKPCKDLAPLIETVIRSREGKATLAKVNIDKVSEVAVQLSVSSIPAVFAFYKKEVVGKFVGLKSKSELEDFVDSVVSKST